MKLSLGLSILTLSAFVVSAWAATGAAPVDPASPAPQGARPKFKSKIHIPVKLAAETTPLPPPGYELVFSDEFDGETIDKQKWGFRLESKMLSTQQAENISLKNGNLEIAMRKESVRGKNYTGGGVVSRQSFVYGYYEARFKTPPAEGWHTSFWAMKKSFPDEPPKPRALLELDFCEQDGGDPHFFSFGVINQAPNPKKKESWNAGRWVIEDAPDTSANFHVWSCEFTPEFTRFYFEGKLMKEISSAGFPHDDMSVWLSVIASTLKGDRWVDESKLPNAVLVDYVRVYQNPKYREAEEAVLAASRLRKPAAAKAKGDGEVLRGGAPAELN
ncbi:MAG: glycoside hydrolase family 16 protein [Opitutaceae bacterium]|jgi:beta-glucanase (GH16 family)|nr:glycoside hydrolase family 16 protein [Opitutaceae bacterium]